MRLLKWVVHIQNAKFFQEKENCDFFYFLWLLTGRVVYILRNNFEEKCKKYANIEFSAKTLQVKNVIFSYWFLIPWPNSLSVFSFGVQLGSFQKCQRFPVLSGDLIFFLKNSFFRYSAAAATTYFLTCI